MHRLAGCWLPRQRGFGNHNHTLEGSDMSDMCEIDRNGDCIQCGRFTGTDEAMRRTCFQAQGHPTMNALLKRLQALAAPCREVDNLIGVAVGNKNLDWGMSHPKFTASIDSAMTLVPEGWQGSMFWPDCQVCLVNPADPIQAVTGFAAAPAIALCIAALKAKAIQ